MAKPWKNAAPICAVLTIVAAVGILLGFLTHNLLWPLLLLLPIVGYEVYRTAGETTRWASWAMAVLLVAALILILFGVSYDLSLLFGEEEMQVAGYPVPLGDVKVVMPALMGVCALILVVRTRGRYTRWLGGVIFVASLAIIYMMSPESIVPLIREAIGHIQ